MLQAGSQANSTTRYQWDGIAAGLHVAEVKMMQALLNISCKQIPQTQTQPPCPSCNPMKVLQETRCIRLQHQKQVNDSLYPSKRHPGRRIPDEVADPLLQLKNVQLAWKPCIGYGLTNGCYVCAYYSIYGIHIHIYVYQIPAA